LKRILLLMVLLILYGSFYPWHFRAVHLTANPLWILLHSWPDVFDRFAFRDAVVNVTLYVPFGVFCFLSLGESRSPISRSALVVLAAATLSASIEMAQLFAPGRVCSLSDVACNVAGAAIGILLGASFPTAISQAAMETEEAGAFRLSAVVALLYLWAGYQLFPFFPAIGRYALRLKLTILSSPEAWSARDLFESLGGWLAASALFESLVGRWIVRALAVALLLLPLRLFIVDRTLSGSEVVGALAGAGLGLLLRRLRRPRLAAGVLTVAALVIAGLLPFKFSSAPQGFIWVPFLPMLQTPWETALLILLRKSFLYGSAVWLLTENRRRWLTASLTVAAALAIVEGLQIFLPGRTPELTDPVLALLLGFGLMLLDRRPSIGRA
jgi:VanZ family protein